MTLVNLILMRRIGVKLRKMGLDDLDILILKENFDEDMIKELDMENVKIIIDYLLRNKVYYAKDLLLNSLDLFLLDSNIFIEKFENLKIKLGSNYVDKLGEDMSLIELMY